MGENTKIEWCEHTFNPWWGCAKVSAGCKHCYAERQSRRFGPMYFGKSNKRKLFGDRHWVEPLAWNRRAMKYKRPAKVFCGSMCDVFEDRADLVEPRRRLFKLINSTPWLHWMLLTKRPKNMMRMLPVFMPPNIWLGVSVENQETADRRIPGLLRHQAQILFVSVEPMLGLIDLLSHLRASENDIHWVILGGETGPHARWMDPDWARSIRKDCHLYGVPFFLKQMARKEPVPEDLQIREFPETI